LRLSITQEDSYKIGLSVYHKIQKENLHYIKDNVGLSDIYTREGLDSVNVIPLMFKESLIKASDIEKSLHEVSISKKKLWMGQKEPDKWFIYFDCEYDYETGLKFLKKNTDKGTTLML
jgi:CRISPR-associated endonuclease/helicase Cas3